MPVHHRSNYQKNKQTLQEVKKHEAAYYCKISGMPFDRAAQ
jgi:hypothetical protein